MTCESCVTLVLKNCTASDGCLYFFFYWCLSLPFTLGLSQYTQNKIHSFGWYFPTGPCAVYSRFTLFYYSIQIVELFTLHYALLHNGTPWSQGSHVNHVSSVLNPDSPQIQLFTNGYQLCQKNSSNKLFKKTSSWQSIRQRTHMSKTAGIILYDLAILVWG